MLSLRRIAKLAQFTDIKMDSVFVDNDGIAFIDDLEYLTEVNGKQTNSKGPR
jgi:hypothetical protein